MSYFSKPTPFNQASCKVSLFHHLPRHSACITSSWTQKRGTLLQLIAPVTMLSLPVDIKVLILPLLDFTSLISLAQTNRHFRQLIDPQHCHFVGRLLQIECLPEHGGEVTIDPWTVFPDTIRYACTRCLKLLPHIRFDNRLLFGIKSKKPPQGCEAANQLCEWTGGDAKAQGLKRQAKIQNDKLEYARLLENSYPATQEAINALNIGKARNKRICIECKFLAGFWARTTRMNVRTSLVPVIKSRQKASHDFTER